MLATIERTRRAETATSNLVVASLEGVNKNYGSVKALRSVDFRVRAGEVSSAARSERRGQNDSREVAAGIVAAQFGTRPRFRRGPHES